LPRSASDCDQIVYSAITVDQKQDWPQSWTQ